MTFEFEVGFSLHETDIAPENRPGPKWKFIFQQYISRGYVSYTEGSMSIDF